jgi:hypothetical protein
MVLETGQTTKVQNHITRQSPAVIAHVVTNWVFMPEPAAPRKWIKRPYTVWPTTPYEPAGGTSNAETNGRSKR